MQQVISNAESGLACRNALNDNFTELYGAFSIPIRLPNVTANTQVTIPANSLLLSVSLFPVSGAPAINIGTTPNGGQITSGVITGLFFLNLGMYFNVDTILYITYTGTGAADIRFDYQKNYF